MLLVVGATGRQGRAVCHAALAAGLPVRALVRDRGADAADALERAGATLVQGDLDDPASLRRALDGASQAFAALPLHPGRPQREAAQGVRLAEAAAEAGLAQLVYSAALWTSHASGVPHLESKRRIRARIAELALPSTVLEPAGFMENLLHPQVLAGVRKGRLATPLPPAVPQALVAVRDIAAAALWCLANPAQSLGQGFALVGDALSPDDQATAIGHWLGRPVACRRMHPWLVRLALGRDLARMFRYIAEDAPAPPAAVLPIAWTPFPRWLAEVGYAR